VVVFDADGSFKSLGSSLRDESRIEDLITVPENLQNKVRFRVRVRVKRGG